LIAIKTLKYNLISSIEQGFAKEILYYGTASQALSHSQKKNDKEMHGHSTQNKMIDCLAEMVRTSIISEVAQSEASSIYGL
jgi:hypothetical protein